MPSVFTLEGAKVSKKKAKGLGPTTKATLGDRRCVLNTRTKQRRPQEFKKTARFKNGAWQFIPGDCE